MPRKTSKAETKISPRILAQLAIADLAAEVLGPFRDCSLQMIEYVVGLERHDSAHTVAEAMELVATYGERGMLSHRSLVSVADYVAAIEEERKAKRTDEYTRRQRFDYSRPGRA